MTYKHKDKCWPWWRHQMENFPHYWPFVRGIHRPPVNFPHKSQWRGALMFSLICAWINGWVNNGEAADLRRHRVHCDVTVMVADVIKEELDSGGELLASSPMLAYYYHGGRFGSTPYTNKEMHPSVGGGDLTPPCIIQTPEQSIIFEAFRGTFHLFQ